MGQTGQLDTAVEAALCAGILLKKHYLRKNTVWRKSAKDFLTRLDVQSETIILRHIRKNYPHHNIFSEELGFTDRHSDYTWIIDPLCSTNNYAFGLCFYGIAIALMHKDEAMLGVIYIPGLDHLFTARKGKGAYLNGKRINVSSRTKLAQSLVLYDNQFYKTRKMLDNLKKFASRSFTLRITGSAAFDAGLVAMGVADARIFHKTKACDFAAAAAIVSAAGGEITNFKGDYPALTDSSVIISNGRIHKQILRLVQ